MSERRLLLPLFPALLASLSCLPAFAADVTDPPQQIEVKGKLDERRDDTASKTVVSHEQITRFGDTSLLDVLKRLPGVSVVGNAIRMRGLGEGYTQVLINGEKAPPGFSVESLAPDAIDKIEILRSASADMSTQAIAGTINIVTRKVVRRTQRELKFSLGDEGGHVTPYLTLENADRNGALSHTTVLAIAQSRFDTPSTGALQYADANGAPTAAATNTQQSSGTMDSIFLTPRLNWKLDEGGSLSSQSLLRYMRSTATMRTQDEVLFGAPPGFAASSNASRTHTGIANTNLNWVHRLDERNVLDTKIGLNLTQRDSDQHFLGEAGATQPRLERDTDVATTDAGLTFSGKDANSIMADHTVVFGWDGASSRRREQRRQSALADEDFAVRVNRLALFAQDEWNLAPRWSIYLGARWEGVSTRSAGSRVQASTNRTSVFSPIVQTLWKLPDSEGSQWRLALARTYKAPSVGNLNARIALANVNTPATPDYQGNPALKPELAWGLDAAFEHFEGEGSMFSVGGYLRRIRDMTGQRLQQVDGRWLSRPDNVGAASSAGLELETKWNLAQVEWRAYGNRNWSRVSDLPGPGNRLDGQTPASLNLSADYRLPHSRLSAGAAFNLQTGGLFRASASETRYSTVTRNLDLYLLWKQDRQNRLRLALSNLLHQSSYSNSVIEDQDGSVVRTQVERSPATVRLTFEHAFQTP